MLAETVSIMGIFASERKAAEAIDGLRETSWSVERVHSPIPSHLIDAALELPKSRVGWFTLAGGINVFDESLIREFGWSRSSLKFRDLLTFALTGLLGPLAGALAAGCGRLRSSRDVRVRPAKPPPISATSTSSSTGSRSGAGV